ncbi:MAG: 50S ribosomal protein L23 [Candidatus Pacebacteria bacterium]|nr:50S ribosomal protein L23 [Candidatus Paceibacterota bacterium]
MGIFTKKEKLKKEEVKKELVVKKKAKSLKVIDPIAWRILDKPYVSEKATELEKENRYTFRVIDGSSKLQIKRAVEEIYGVGVISVNTVSVPRKKKKMGKFKGWRKSFKKAIVQIKEGEKISIDK